MMKQKILLYLLVTPILSLAQSIGIVSAKIDNMMFDDINKNRCVNIFKITQNLPPATNKTELSGNASIFSSAALGKLQQLRADIKETPQINFEKKEEKLLEKKSIWKILKGNELESSIKFLPYGLHTKDGSFVNTFYIGYNYKSFEIAAFNNSYDDLTILALYNREIQLYEKLSLIYGLGIMYGYDGKLQNVSGIPFRNSFLYSGPINLSGGIIIDNRAFKNLSLQLNISPVVLVFGVRFIL